MLLCPSCFYTGSILSGAKGHRSAITLTGVEEPELIRGLGLVDHDGEFNRINVALCVPSFGSFPAVSFRSVLWHHRRWRGDSRCSSDLWQWEVNGEDNIWLQSFGTGPSVCIPKRCSYRLAARAAASARCCAPQNGVLLWRHCSFLLLFVEFEMVPTELHLDTALQPCMFFIFYCSMVQRSISLCHSLMSYFTGLGLLTYLSNEASVVIIKGLSIIALT